MKQIYEKIVSLTRLRKFATSASKKTIALTAILLMIGGWNSAVYAAWSGSGQAVKKDGNTYYVLYETGESYFGTSGSKDYNLSGPGAVLTFQAYRNMASGVGNLVVEDSKGNTLFDQNPQAYSYKSYSGSKNCDVDATSITFSFLGSYRRYFKNVKVTMAQYLNNPTKTDLDCGTADINSESTSGQVNVAWCNVPAMSYEITDDAEGLFSVSVDVNSEAGKYNTSHFTVTYKHTKAGTHTAKLKITDSYNSYSKTVNLTGTTNKLQPTVDWEPNDSYLNVGDELSATNANGLQVTLSGNANYVTCSGNEAIMTAPTTNAITISATIKGNDIYADRVVTKDINITNKTKQHISWGQDYALAHFKTTDTQKSLTLDATASSNLPVTYELQGDKTGLTLTQSGKTWTLTYSATECKNTTIVAKQAGDATYAPAPSISFQVKVIDPTKECDVNNTLITSTAPSELSNEEKILNLTIPSTIHVEVSRIHPNWIYSNGFELKFYSESNGKGDELRSESYSASNINPSKTIDLSGLSRDIKSVKLISNATWGYKVTSLTYTEQKYCEVSDADQHVDITTYPNTSTSTSPKKIHINYANYPIYLECANSKFTISPLEFGECGVPDNQEVTISYTAGADEGTDVGYLLIKDNKGSKLGTCTLNVTISKLAQSITSHTIANSYKTTDRIELSAVANSDLTAFEYSASPSGVASFDGNVMTFSQSGNIAITVTQPGNNVYASTSATVNNVVVSKVTPTLTAPTAGALTYLDKLSESEIADGGVAKVTLRGVANTEVAGSFEWTNKNYKVVETPGNNSYQVTFTPTDGGMYTTNTCNVTIAVNKAEQAISMNDGSVRVKVTGIDANATDSRLDLSTLIASQTEDPVDANRDGAVSFEIVSAQNNPNNVNTVTINGNTFTATACDVYTVRARKASTNWYNEKTTTFKVTVIKRDNTLATAASYTRYVTEHIGTVATTINSNGTIHTSSTAPTIAHYDFSQNKIIIDNSGNNKFDETTVTIKIWQDATDQFTGIAEADAKTIDVTVKKYDNKITYTWAGESNRTWTEFLNFGKGAYVYFDSNNKDDGAPAIMVTQDPKTTSYATYYPDQHAIYAAHNVSIAKWTVSQDETFKYKGDTCLLSLVIGTITSSGCNMFEYNPGDNTTASQIHVALPEKGTAGMLYFEMKSNGTFGNDATVSYLVGTEWRTTSISSSNKNEFKEYYLPNQSEPGIPLDPDATAIRFAKSASVLG